MDNLDAVIWSIFMEEGIQNKQGVRRMQLAEVATESDTHSLRSFKNLEVISNGILEV